MSFEFTTQHKMRLGDAAYSLQQMEEDFAHLIVTSPPYPMVKMWDGCFSTQSAQYRVALDREDGRGMWHEAHEILCRVWDECARVLKPGGYLCINIGDGLRRVGERFEFYSNTAPIDCYLKASTPLIPHPPIIWRKPSNSPTKFLGSGMLPAGAYVTMEHEHILIYRKGGRREFKGKVEQERRRASALFWEERNAYFTDLWAFPGVRQTTDQGRRTGAYPLELPMRLIAMFSLYGDVVIDPFAGTGTTMHAAMSMGRNSMSVEHDAEAFVQPEIEQIHGYGYNRWVAHKNWLQENAKHPTVWNERLQCGVKSSQERDLYVIESWKLKQLDGMARVQTWEVKHADITL